MADAITPKMKKLPFKPTALRNRFPAASSTPSASQNVTPGENSSSAKGKGKEKEKAYDDGLDLFRRSEEMKPIVAADQKRRMRRQMKKAEDEKVAERRSLGHGTLHGSAPEKRAQLNNLEEEDAGVLVVDDDQAEPSRSRTAELSTAQAQKDDVSSELATPPPSKHTSLGEGSSKKRATPHDGHQLDDSPSARKTRSAGKPAASPPSHFSPNRLGSSSAPLILDDSDSDHNATPTPSKQPFQSGSRIQSLNEQQPAQEADDDEFSEYVRRAEEKRAQTLAEQNADSQARKKKVNILVTSRIEGSKTCQIKYFFDRQFHQLRQAWTDAQARVNLHVPDTDDLILTWRQNKVYTYSTLSDLGIRPYGDFGIITDGNTTNGLTNNGSMVHMEVWTPQLFEEYLEQEQVRRRREAGELPEEEEEAPEPLEDIKFKINLKARNQPELGLTVRPETTVETLITAFRSQRSVPQDKEITLRFDDELLEEHQTMADTDIDEMDIIEVHIK